MEIATILVTEALNYWFNPPHSDHFKDIYYSLFQMEKPLFYLVSTFKWNAFEHTKVKLCLPVLQDIMIQSDV